MRERDRAAERRRGRERYDRWAALAPFAGWYPGAVWASAPEFGWGWWGGAWGWPPAPYPPADGGFRDAPRPRAVHPRESGLYGRGGDRAARRWAERYGYDVEHTIRPRRSEARPRGLHARYDRDW